MTLIQKIKAVLDEANKDLLKEAQLLEGMDLETQLFNVKGHRQFILAKIKAVLDHEIYK